MFYGREEHLSRFANLGASTRAEATSIALRRGLLG